MKITIETIPHDLQRYETVGDWKFNKKGDLTISVSQMGDFHYEMLVAVHELIEVLLCQDRGIEQETVDAFDIAFEEARKPGNLDEPGDSKKAPYHKEHVFATVVEKLLSKEFKVKWKDYEKTINEL